MQGRFGSLENPKKFKDQDFDYLREYCQNQHIWFEDETFPAHISSIGPGLLSEDKLLRLKWMRPRNIHKDPQLLVDGASRFDIIQGYIGDCWVLSALGALTTQRHFLEKVLPTNQGFAQSYSGIFHFRFWQFGDWVDVVIDDRLPYLDGRLFFVQPRSRNEFWPSLLEKAYAKLRGSYRNLHWGFISEALEDFTGGVNMGIRLLQAPSNIWDILLAALKSRSLIGCATPKGQDFSNSQLKNGLVEGHSYTVTGAKRVPYKNGWEDLIRIWNPWGKGEWNGPWSDKSPEWENVDSNVRKNLNMAMEDGEFWMSCKDFLQQFVVINICNLTPIYLDFEDQLKQWSTTLHVSPWVKRSLTEDGFVYDTFFKNPHCLVTVAESDRINKGCNVVAALMQKTMFSKDRLLPIGLMVLQVDPKDLKDGLPESFFCPKTAVGLKNGLLESREVIMKLSLYPGTYIIIPYRMHKELESDFLLRVYLRSIDYAEEVRDKLSLNVSKTVPKKYYDDTYENIFAQYCNGAAGIESSQLQMLLNDVVLNDRSINVEGEGFSLDACRGILLLMDLNVNGRLNLTEFKGLWKRLNISKKLFREYDANRSGCLGFSGLQDAVQAAGFAVSLEMLNLMLLRYGDSGRINFPNFVCCMIRLQTVTKAFQHLTKDGRGVYLSEEELLQIIMSS